MRQFIADIPGSVNSNLEKFVWTVFEKITILCEKGKIWPFLPKKGPLKEQNEINYICIGYVHTTFHQIPPSGYWGRAAHGGQRTAFGTSYQRIKNSQYWIIHKKDQINLIFFLPSGITLPILQEWPKLWKVFVVPSGIFHIHISPSVVPANRTGAAGCHDNH